MSHDDDSLLHALDGMSDAELNAEITTCLGYKGQLPTVRHVLDRLHKECKIDTKMEPTENPDSDTPSQIFRVYIKPLAYRAISVTAPTQSRAVRVALLVWLRYDPSAPAVVRKVLRL